MSTTVPPPLTSPHDECRARRDDRASRFAAFDGRQEGIANARLALFLLGLVVAYLVFGAPQWRALWLAPVALAFLGLVVWSERTKRGAQRAARAVAFYERALARMEDRWAQGLSPSPEGDEAPEALSVPNGGETGARFLDPAHPYAPDLDLFGEGSLYAYLNVARTRGGEEALARWLLGPAPVEEVRARQRAVAEMAGLLDLREGLALGGADVREGIEPEALAAWGAAPRVMGRKALLWVATGASALAIAALWGWLFGPLPASVFLCAALLLLSVYLLNRRQIGVVVKAVEKRAHDLELLAELLDLLEAQAFRSPRLARLREALEVEGRPPAREVRRLGRLVATLDAMQNQLFAPFGALLLWPVHLAWWIDRWRSKHGPRIDVWIKAVGEFEAFASFGAYAFESPEAVYPEIVEAGPLFSAKGLGHPLIPRSRVVRNDVELGGELRALVVSGSNMSGKSTLLRAVGTNAVLALAGAPVRAHEMRISPLAVGGALRAQDSLMAGKSRFYAEITRVRQLVDVSRGPVPLLFLLDEIFSGTNSHERCQGAEAIVRGLINAGAIGLVTTHDLALAEIAEKLAPQAINVHFEDQFEEGRLSFDYAMRPGIVRKSNALALMRAVGLEV